MKDCLIVGKFHSGERDQISKTLRSYHQPRHGPPLKLGVRGQEYMNWVGEGLEFLPQHKSTVSGWRG